MKLAPGFVIAVVTATALVACTSESEQVAWPEAGFAVDRLGVAKAVLAECCFRGKVRGMQLGNFDDDAATELAVVPQTGVYLFDAETLEVEPHVEFTSEEGGPVWFGLTPYLLASPKRPGFWIAMRGGGYGDVGLLDRAGRRLWTFDPHPRNSPPRDMAVDDRNGAALRFYVCGDNAIYRLDATGRVVWKVDEDANHIVLAAGSEGAAFATARGRGDDAIEIWSDAGKRILRIPLPAPASGLASVDAHGISGFVVNYGRAIAFVDRSGEVHFQHAYDYVPVYHGPNAALVRLVAGAPPLLAVVMESRSATSRSVLTLFTLDGDRVYEEYLNGGPGIGVVPVAGEGRERLIVGDGPAKVWVYEKAPTPWAGP
jgi:hypothetical protein